MKIVSSFLPELLIEEIETYVKQSKNNKNGLWYNNSIWEENIVKNSGLVSILPLHNFSEKIKNYFILYDKKFIEYTICVQYYEWYRGSYIPWHNDSCYDYGATLYLNKNWDVEDGGIFFYIEKNKTIDDLQCIYPKYNKLIINDCKEEHHVSLINYHSKEIRKTLQIWMHKNTKKFQSVKLNYK